MRKARKIAIGALSVTMAATIAASQVIAFASKNNYSGFGHSNVSELSFNKLTDSIDLSNIARNQFAANVTDYGEKAEEAYFKGTYSTKTVIVELDTPSIIESMGNNGTVAEYLATAKGRSALGKINDSQNAFLKSLSSAAISYKLVNKYSTVTNAVAIEVNTSKFNQIAKMRGVSDVGISLTYSTQEIDAQENYSNVYGTGIYDSSDIINGYGYDGTGVTVAILDTGLDYTHEAFTKYLPEEDTLGMDREYVETKLKLTDNSGVPTLIAAQRTSGLSVSDVYISDKVPFAYDYSDNDADVYPSYSQHGTHVAGIVAGKADTYYDKDGNEFKDFRGVAPEAQLVICKVFTDDLNSTDLGGARSEDIIAALDDCVTLGVDIINMSLGTTSGFSSMDDDDIDGNGKDLNRVYNNIQAAGISLIAAAGNEYSSGFGSDFGTNLASNPDSGTVGSPSTYAGAMSVASVNGQQAPYMVGNPGESSKYGDTPIYYYESNDANAVAYDFAEELLGDKQSDTFTYLVIPGTGSKSDYSMSVQNRLNSKGANEKILVLVRRGTLSFKEKVETAWSMHADGIIVYNNVSGTIRMSLSDIDESKRIPAVSINADAGAVLSVDPNNSTRLRSEGKITIDKNNLAGPFMDDYSSWGATPDLKLKPDITSHGGDITSTVSGGYEVMSGTSMATPNLAGLMALVKNYIKVGHSDLVQGQNGYLDSVKLTTLTNQIVMSSATLLYDQNHLPYSPRKQGAGLATLKNIFETQAYLWTETAEDNRPKIELGEDEEKKGEYSFAFYVTNFGNSSLNFQIVSRFFTETLSADGLAVAQAAYMFDDIAASFKVNGEKSNGNISVASGNTAKIEVTLKLSDTEKKYLDASFKNGMYVEGFISLVSQNSEQCDLNLPFMGFYGDWEAAPMLDYNAYEISAIEQDTSKNDNEKEKASVYATQLYSTYYNGRYALPMGSYAYLQDASAVQVYTTEEYCAISRFNIYNGATAKNNYMTSTGIRALYAGLLRNAELVTYDIYNVDTGEIVYQGRDYSVGKAYSGGGSARPALVDMKLDTEELGLLNNGKYEIEFNFYMKSSDEATNKGQNTFSSNFYVDYDAPILQSSRIRYVDKKVGNKTTQQVWLDLDIYDNHYPQAVLLCYSDREYGTDETATINLATDYVTPIYNPVRNSTNTVHIDITDIYAKYKDTLYVQIDDYALNHNVYLIDFSTANAANQGDDFKFVTTDGRITQSTLGGITTYNLTLEKNELYKIELDCGTGMASNYNWSTTRPDLVKLKNGEIFGLAEGSATVFVSGTAYNSNGVLENKTLTLYVTIKDSDRVLSRPTISFGLIKGVNSNLQLAQGTNVEVNAGQTFKFEIISDPWYYPVENLTLEWESSDEKIATVTQDGIVTTLNEKGYTIISAYIMENGRRTQSSATVTLKVADPFYISNNILNRYYGSSETVVIPDDKNIMYIGEEAFEDNDTMKVVIIPQTVTEISERAFLNCTALEEVYFIKKTNEGDKPVTKLSALNLILANAFSGCVKLRLLDLTNVKVITVADYAFAGTPLEEIRRMDKMGIAGNYSFAGTSLKEIDISGLHTSGVGVFYGCTSLTAVNTGIYTSMGVEMFFGCTALEEIQINNQIIPGSAFEDCTKLHTVTFGGSVLSIGDYAFANTAITKFTMPKGVVIGDGLFAKIIRDKNGNIIEIRPNNEVDIDWTDYQKEGDGAVYNGTTLVKAPSVIDSTFRIKDGTTVIGDYAFADCTLDGVTTVTIPETVTEIGIGAFARSEITGISIPSSLKTISAYAFMGSSLESVTIPSTVTRIEEGAFAECKNLSQIDFAGNSTLNYIGSGAFSGTVITNIVLPDSVTTMGDMVFFGCDKLETVKLPNLTSLGGYTFEGCTKLKEATFGEAATASGYNTFFPGYVLDENGDIEYEYDDYGNGTPKFLESVLDTVNLGGLKKLGDGVFAACTSLTSINLANVTKIGNETFANCYNLAAALNLDKVTEIGLAAFANTALTSLNLANAVEIGAQAFINVVAESLSILKAEIIGAQAFAGIAITELVLPTTLKVYGDGAFMAAENLRYVKVGDKNEGNEKFFAEDNVLYRRITNARTGAVSFELCLYPSARQATANKYTVKEGTSTIQAYSFAYLNQTSAAKLVEITLPYSVKTIGAWAFFCSFAITTYNFESIEAPRLLSEFYETSLSGSIGYTLFYTNFYYIFDYMGGFVEEPLTLTIGYPSNGKGYDNYVFSQYFAASVNLGELMDDNTRGLIALIASIISDWNSLDADNAEKAQIEALSNDVKTAHGMYNGLASAKQREYLGNDRAKQLFDIEEALKPLKAKFGITANISTVSLSSTSTHKAAYKVGEYFDLTGLVLQVDYDDYTSELISDISKVTLLSTGALQSYITSVAVEYEGFIFRVPVTVTASGDGTITPGGNTTPDDGNGGSNGDSSSKLGIILGCSIGGVALLAAAAVVTVLFVLKKRH